MELNLDNTTHPTVELLSINLNQLNVTFRNVDGICTCPLIGDFSEILPTIQDVTTSIEAVLGEV